VALDVAAALLWVRLACEDKLERDQRGGVILSDLVAPARRGRLSGWVMGLSALRSSQTAGRGYVQAAVRSE
jgi:hypothetical protein